MGKNIPDHSKQKLNLLIISNMAHYQRDNRIVGWGPAVQEIDAFSGLFNHIRHIGCLHTSEAPLSALPYLSQNITFVPLTPAGGDSLSGKLGIVKNLPFYIKTIWNELSKADIVHVRCPANIPLFALSILVMRQKPLYRWFKYAGNWQLENKQPWSYRLQRWILYRNIANGLVTINGEWPNQPEHIYNFFNPCLYKDELVIAREVVTGKQFRPPYQLIYVGALFETKGVGRVLEIAEKLTQDAIPFELNLLGDGPNRINYEKWCLDRGLQNNIHFRGWLPKPELRKYYSAAHIILLPSQSEGWPKVLSEGMAFGVVPIAGAVSCIPQILGETGAGDALPTFDTDSFVAKIKLYIANPKLWQQKSSAGINAVEKFTYEFYVNQLREVFNANWHLEFLL